METADFDSLAHTNLLQTSQSHCCIARSVGHYVGSRRRRLWDLAKTSHCPVVGVCVPLQLMRKLVTKSLGGRIPADDYEIHVNTVAQCGTRNPLSELLYRELEQRYATTIQQFRSAKSPEGVWELWATAVNAGNVAGPFWAALTHPHCDAALEEGLCRDMHMIQHQAGSLVRADIQKYRALQEKTDALEQQLKHIQEKNARTLADKAAEIDRLEQCLLLERAQRNEQERIIADLRRRFEQLETSIPELEERMQLKEKLDQTLARQNALQAEVRRLRQIEAASQQQNGITQMEQSSSMESVPESTTPPLHSDLVTLQNRTVLCVGGRTGNVAAYRQFIEKTGAQFAFHDGGIEDTQGMLDASLAAADMVICQTGCISHGAYWRVKDFCKRTGKQCIFVDNPSRSALARSLQVIAVSKNEN